MADLKVNTDAVVSAAGKIRSCNNTMRNSFSNVENTITKLDSSWDGSVAVMAINKFNQIRVDFCDSRYKVMDNYVNFLLQQVGQGYEQTQNANKSLADQFM